MLYTPAHTIPNKSHLGEGLRAFPTRGNCHPLSCQNNKIVSGVNLFLIHCSLESSAGCSSSHTNECEMLCKEEGKLLVGRKYIKDTNLLKFMHRSNAIIIKILQDFSWILEVVS